MTDLKGLEPKLFTIGYSTLPWETFVSMLKAHSISAVADVRSKPFSRFNPQFNQQALQDGLRQASISYAFLGRELGARRIEREAYRDGQARYDLIRHLPAYAEGLERIRRGIDSHRVALLCAEADPATCHRAVLVGRSLRSIGPLAHILRDGRLETTAQLESRLVALCGLSQEDLFETRESKIEHAYEAQSQRIAYTERSAQAGRADAR